MKSHPTLIILTLIFCAFQATAQTAQPVPANSAPQAVDSTAPAANALPPKPYHIDKTHVFKMCKKPELLACLELDETVCKTMVSEAVDEANAAADVKAGTESPSPAWDGYVQGFAAGKFMGRMTGKTKGKYYSCMTK
jgi:hypothetical protein